ncbi:MAG: hypothetical protein M1463_04275 [Candidatus Thermoplasmatota archaeon]|nr:hypothetical protein [Candidatus Thermoplasmatota archaeon]
MEPQRSGVGVPLPEEGSNSSSPPSIVPQLGFSGRLEADVLLLTEIMTLKSPA